MYFSKVGGFTYVILLVRDGNGVLRFTRGGTLGQKPKLLLFA